MSKLEEIIQTYRDEQARQAAERQAQQEKEEAAERDRLLTVNQALRERVRLLLGAELFDELAPPGLVPENVITLISGGGYRYAYIADDDDGDCYLMGHGWNGKKISIPADDVTLGKFFAACQAERAQDAQRAYDDSLWANPDRIDQIMYQWPDLAPAIQAAREERDAKLAADEATEEVQEAQNRTKANENKQALLDAIRDDAVAVALIKLFAEITRDREKWQYSIDQLNYSLDSTYSDSSRAKQKASEAAAATLRAESEARDAQYRADDAERKYTKIKREAERGW